MSQSSNHLKSTEVIKENPFIGLRAFDESESHLFFGRDKEVYEVRNALFKKRFLTLVGADGCGKTSLIHAGLIPNLRLFSENNYKGRKEWLVLNCVFESKPYENLAIELLSNANADYLDDNDFAQQVMVITTILRKSKSGLVDALNLLSIDKNKNILLIVDQFEEPYKILLANKLHNEIDDIFAFLSLLVEAFEENSTFNLYQLLCVRTEHTSSFAKNPKLVELINDSQYLLSNMSREQLREALEGPINMHKGGMTEQLKQTILDEINEIPAQLPIYQHTLLRLWSYWIRNGGYETGDINHRHYNEIARVENALSVHAEEVYNKLDIDNKNVAEYIFKSICNRGSGGKEQRKPIKISDIAKIYRVNVKKVKTVVDHFREEERGFLLPSFKEKLEHETIIDVSYYELVNTWERLKSWVEEEEKNIRLYLGFALAAKSDTEFLHGTMLEQAKDWLKKGNVSREWGKRMHPAYERTLTFINKSIEEDETQKQIRAEGDRKKQRRSQLLAGVLGLFTLVLIILVIYGFIQTGEASEKAKIAELNAEKAIINETKAKENASKAKEAAQKVLQQKDSLDLAYEELSIAVTIAEEQKQIAIKNAHEAKLNEERFRRQSIIASTAEVKANEERANANAEKRNSEKLRALATAKSVAIKALQLNDNQLKTLLVLHAYELNKRNDGNRMDHDIYNGLHKVYRNFENLEDFSYQAHEGSVRKIYLMKNNMITTGGDGKILEWDLQDKSYRVIQDLGYHFVSNVTIDISPNKRYLISGNTSSYIQLIDLKKANSEQKAIKVHRDRIWALKFIDNDRFISAGSDSTLCIVKNQEVFNVGELTSKVNDIQVASSKRHAYIALNDGSVNDLTMHYNDYYLKELFRTAKNSAITALAIRNNGKEIAVGQEDGNIFIIEARSGEILNRLVGFNSYITDLVYSPEGTILGATSRNSDVRLWFMEDLNAQPLLLEDHQDWVWSIIFDDNTKYLYTGDQLGNIYRYLLDPDEIASKLCQYIRREVTKEEWNSYVGNLEYQRICQKASGQTLFSGFYDFYE